MNRSGVGKTHALALRKRLVVSSWGTWGKPSLLRGPQFARAGNGNSARSGSHPGRLELGEQRNPSLHSILSPYLGWGEGKGSVQHPRDKGDPGLRQAEHLLWEGKVYCTTHLPEKGTTSHLAPDPPRLHREDC